MGIPNGLFSPFSLGINKYSSDGGRLVPPLFDALHQIGTLDLEVGQKVSDLHAVHARAALVRDNRLERTVQVAPFKNGFQFDHLVRTSLVMCFLRQSSDPSPSPSAPLDSVSLLSGVPFIGPVE